MPNYSLEKSYKIYNDSTGEYIEVCPDADGLDLVEIRFVLEDGTINTRITMSPEQAELVATALGRMRDL